MNGGYGPHDIVNSVELSGTLVILAFAIMAMIWMAYQTRWRQH